MSKVNKKQFLEDVRTEIESIKLHATKKEKSRLNFKEFKPAYSEDCVYGQLTGDCRSERAIELIEKSCVRIWDLSEKNVDIDKIKDASFEEAKSFLNGAFDKETFGDGCQYLSALEGYIVLKRANNENILAYIKGETDKLKL